MTLLGPMNLLSTVAEQLQGPSLVTALPACCQTAGVVGTGVCATWSAGKTSQKCLTEAPEDQLLEVQLGRIFAARGFRIAGLEVQSSDRSTVKSSSQPRTVLSSPATSMEQTLPTTRKTSSTRLSTLPVCIEPDQGQDLAPFQTQNHIVSDAKAVSGSPQSHESSNRPISNSVSVPENTIGIVQDTHVNSLLTQQLPSAVAVQKTSKNPRSRSDVDGPHTAQVAKKRRRLSWNQTTSPLSEPSSTPGSSNLTAPATAASSDTGPRWWKQARLSQSALARRQIFLMGVQRQRSEVQGAQSKIFRRARQANDNCCTAGDSAVMTQSDASTIESLAAPGARSGHVSTYQCASVNDYAEPGRQQLRKSAITNASASHEENSSHRTPNQRQAVKDPAAHLVAARTRIFSQLFISETDSVPLLESCRKPIAPIRLKQPLANIQTTTRGIQLPPSSSTIGQPTPQGNLQLAKEEIDSEEEDENELAFPTFKYESRYFASDYEDDGMEIFADLAGMWPEAGDDLQIDMDAEYEEMGTFGISKFA